MLYYDAADGKPLCAEPVTVGLVVQLARELNMHHCDLCGAGCNCRAWRQCLEGPSWPPSGPASRTLWWGIGVACLPVQAILSLGFSR